MEIELTMSNQIKTTPARVILIFLHSRTIDISAEDYVGRTGSNSITSSSSVDLQAFIAFPAVCK